MRRIVARPLTVGGEQYLVAPLTIITPGVWSGGVFGSRQVLAECAHKWNGLPITLNHLPRGADGRFDAAVRDRTAIGTVLVPWTAGDGGIRADGWFNVEALEEIAPEVLARLRRGLPIPASAGQQIYFRRAPSGATYNSRPYTVLAYDIQPDHLAVSTRMVAACPGAMVFNGELTSNVEYQQGAEDVSELAREGPEDPTRNIKSKMLPERIKRRNRVRRTS
jgi:hypothetical protein